VGHGASTVVDPQAQDLERYLEFAALKQTKITQVIDTHIQADHASGGRALAAQTGAAYSLHESADVAFPFTPLADGQELVCGNVTTRVLHTPGHTSESLSLVVTDRTRGPEPWFVLTGDTLFVGTVGRPDLPGAMEASARALYRSVQRLLALPDHTEIYPTHFSGSACGKGMSGKPMSTMAFEKRFNPLLSIASEDAFVAALTAELPPKPAGMEAMLRQNQGRA
jgi:glyoxylase-like metal-dependent hydrolase (beta-lactamase superfamily II)